MNPALLPDLLSAQAAIRLSASCVEQIKIKLELPPKLEPVRESLAGCEAQDLPFHQ